MFKYLKEFTHKIFYFLKLILKSKKTYFKPKNKDFLVLDNRNIQILETYFPKSTNSWLAKAFDRIKKSLFYVAPHLYSLAPTLEQLEEK